MTVFSKCDTVYPYLKTGIESMLVLGSGHRQGKASIGVLECLSILILGSSEVINWKLLRCSILGCTSSQKVGK